MNFRAWSRAWRMPLVVLTASMLSGCGTFALSGAIQSSGKTVQQQQLDTLTCKDQARLAANTADRQVGAFLLGMTIVGTPIAYELEKNKQREVFSQCMTSLGYTVLPPSDTSPPNATKLAAPSTPISVPITEPVRFLPDGTQFQRIAIGRVSYPSQAEFQKLTSNILVKFSIDSDGIPADLSILRRDLNKQTYDLKTVFDQAALDVIKYSRWKILKLDGEPRKIYITQPVIFSLPNVPDAQVAEAKPMVGSPITSTVLATSTSDLPTQSKSQVGISQASTVDNDIGQLEKLKILREKNLITDEEYQTKRRIILDRL